jgi:hypothetical protein
MPKEIVYGSELPYGTHEEPGRARSVAEVSWSREGEHVQLVTRCVEASTLETYRGPEIQEERGELTYADGMYISLDRRGINALIRNLRRARNQAFERDE